MMEEPYPGSQHGSSKWPTAQRAIACCRCRKRKKRCDKRRPVCGECARSNAECLPLLPKKSATLSHPPLAYVHLLEDRIASLETRLKSTNPSIAGDHLEENHGQTFSPGSFEAQAEMPSFQLDIPSDPPDDEGPMDGLFDNYNAGQPNQSLPVDWQLNLDVTDGWMIGNDGNNAEDELMDYSLVERNMSRRTSIVDDEPSRMAMTRVDTASTALAEKHLSLNVAESYVSEYFSSAHRMWPFLHQTQWHEWWNRWSDQIGRPGDWRSFFVDMVLSVGALVVHGYGRNPEHLQASKASYQRAMSQHDSYAIQDRSPLIRTQSSLLLTVHAMHVDSVGDLFTRASEVVRNCALLDLSHHKSRKTGPLNEEDRTLDLIRKMTNRSCVIIGILITYTMSQAASLDESVVEELPDEDTESTVSSEELAISGSSPGTNPTPADIALESQMFELRKIQHRILRLIRKLEYEARKNSHVVPNLWRSRMRYDLEKWTTNVRRLSESSEHRSRFQSVEWLEKLANYTVMSLFPNPYLAVRGGEARHLVAATCSVLSTFRRLRVKDSTTCFTWTALLHQFQAGITVAFCLWATPTHQQAEYYDRRNICRAVFACSATLNDFASNWATARVFSDVFDILVETLPLTEFGDPAQHWSISETEEVVLWRYIDQLKELKVQSRVVSMLESISNGARPPYTKLTVEETEWIQYEHRDDNAIRNGGSTI